MSFEIALSGIQAINDQLDAVSNNIANAGTYGFKSSRANFSSVYAGAQANGVEVGSMTQSIGLGGSVTSTGRALDAAIDGRGFFVSRDATGSMAYSRVGIFSANKDGNLVDSAGRNVQGFGPSKGGALGTLGDIKVPTGQIPAQASAKVSYVGNLSADWQAPTAPFNAADSKSYNMAKQTVLFDSLGSQHTVTQYFVKGAGNNVTVHYGFDGAAPATTNSLAFDSQGQLTTTAPISLALAPSNGAALMTFSIDYDGTTMFAGEAMTTTNNSDGYASGSFVGVELAEDGSVVAKYSNEQKQVVGTVAIATFADEGALTSVSDTSWVSNAASGVALYGVPGAGLGGKLNTGALEGSNVDITSELVGLMTSQRNYQANSKVITTENAMMQALMQAL
ncbi:MAG TPA: flagellar hook-basal body complex protein [Telluria sp.]